MCRYHLGIQILGHKLPGPNASLSVGQSYKDFNVRRTLGVDPRPVAPTGVPRESRYAVFLAPAGSLSDNGRMYS